MALRAVEDDDIAVFDAALLRAALGFLDGLLMQFLRQVFGFGVVVAHQHPRVLVPGDLG